MFEVLSLTLLKPLKKVFSLIRCRSDFNIRIITEDNVHYIEIENLGKKTIYQLNITEKRDHSSVLFCIDDFKDLLAIKNKHFEAGSLSFIDEHLVALEDRFKTDIKNTDAVIAYCNFYNAIIYQILTYIETTLENSIRQFELKQMLDIVGGKTDDLILKENIIKIKSAYKVFLEIYKNFVENAESKHLKTNNMLSNSNLNLRKQIHLFMRSTDSVDSSEFVNHLQFFNRYIKKLKENMNISPLPFFEYKNKCFSSGHVERFKLENKIGRDMESPESFDSELFKATPTIDLHFKDRRFKIELKEKSISLNWLKFRNKRYRNNDLTFKKRLNSVFITENRTVERVIVGADELYEDHYD